MHARAHVRTHTHAPARAHFIARRNTSAHADYNTTVNSWVEQRRLFVTDGPLRVIAAEQPALAASLAAAFDEIASPLLPQTGGLKPVSGDPTTQLFTCVLGRLGGRRRFDNAGSGGGGGGGGGGGAGGGDGGDGGGGGAENDVDDDGATQVVTVGFDSRGAVTTLLLAAPAAGNGSNASTTWASAAAPLGLYEYQTFDNEVRTPADLPACLRVRVV
jgi:hypothetical protein